MIKVVDYGVGNIQAFLNLYKRLGVNASRADSPAALADADFLILPGVGHFDHAMSSLNDSGLRDALEAMVMNDRVPLLGVCVGMQMLSSGSDEGKLPGLGWIPGRVRSFAESSGAKDYPQPHMGWNNLTPRNDSTLFSKGFDSDIQFYFLHSYYFDANNKNDVAATANYGFDFDAAVSRGHIHGIQCHPEKSHHWGVQLLKNFSEIF